MSLALPDFAVERMESLSVAGSGVARVPPVPEAARSPDFEARHDFDTLWYDAVRLAPGKVRLICPRLFNLRLLLNDASLTSKGHRVLVRRVRTFRRHDEVDLVGVAADRLEVTLARWRAESGVSPDRTDHFAGLNVSLHLSRENRLEWIADWARFHVAAHGLEAMLLMDNGSRSYPPEAILEALAGTGLKRAVVLAVPQPYGPPRSKRHPGTAKYLQPAMLNLARLRYLSKARAVLNADIDELVWRRGGSVFDAAVESPLGYVSFAGAWRLPRPEADDPPRHADHVLPRADGKTCPTKYCVVPAGPIGRRAWDVHRPDWALLPSRMVRRDIGYWHCQAITTNWKAHDRLRPRAAGAPDPETEAMLARYLPGPGGGA